MALSRRTVSSDEGDWYDHPKWYDVVHGPGTADDVDVFERLAMRYVRTRSISGEGVRVLEPACGTGRYLRVLAGRGYNVVGFDIKEGMVAYARRGLERRGLAGDVFVGDMTAFSISPKADFAFCPFSTIRHLMTDDALLAHFACVARALRRGGVYIVGLDLARYGREAVSEDFWSGARGRLLVTQRVGYTPGSARMRLERVRSELVVRTPTRRQVLRSRYDLRTYNEAQWLRVVKRSELRQVGAFDQWDADIVHVQPTTADNGYRNFVLAHA